MMDLMSITLLVHWLLGWALMLKLYLTTNCIVINQFIY